MSVFFFFFLNIPEMFFFPVSSTIVLGDKANILEKLNIIPKNDYCSKDDDIDDIFGPVFLSINAITELLDI